VKSACRNFIKTAAVRSLAKIEVLKLMDSEMEGDHLMSTDHELTARQWISKVAG
jgi:hypothetical protein